MTKIAFALAIINFIRKEKQPPLLRHCILLALASASAPLSRSELRDMLDEDGNIDGSTDSMLRHGLIDAIERPHRRGRAYTITPAGQQEAARILSAGVSPQSKIPA
jgi:DNA-binding PadR family transcriptional regulator